MELNSEAIVAPITQTPVVAKDNNYRPTTKQENQKDPVFIESTVSTLYDSKGRFIRHTQSYISVIA